MCVVKLDSNRVGKLLPRLLALLETTNDIVERGSAPEVLLLQAKLLTTLKVVVGVEHRGDSLSTLLVRHRALVLARVELLEIKLAASGLAAPKTKVVASTSLVSRNRYVKSNSLHNLAALPRALLLALIVLPAVHLAVELHVNDNVVALELPGVEVEPVVWDLDLVSVHNLLLKDTISVAQAVAPSWVVERRHRVEEAGGKTSETTVAERGVVLLGYDIFHAEAEVGETLCSCVRNVKGGIWTDWVYWMRRPFAPR